MRSALKLRARLRLPTPSLRRAARKARTSRAWSARRCFMSGEKSEELRDISFVGFRRVGRELPLDGEISEPIADRLADVRRPHITRRCGFFRQGCDPRFGL